MKIKTAETRIVGILTDSGRYYESHEYRDLGRWYGEALYDLTEDRACEFAKKLPRHLSVNVRGYLGIDGAPVTSFILA